MFSSISKSLIIFIFTNVHSFTTQVASRRPSDVKILVANWNVNFQSHAAVIHIMNHAAFEEEFGFVTLN